MGHNSGCNQIFGWRMLWCPHTLIRSMDLTKLSQSNSSTSETTTRYIVHNKTSTDESSDQAKLTLGSRKLVDTESRRNGNADRFRKHPQTLRPHPGEWRKEGKSKWNNRRDRWISYRQPEQESGEVSTILWRPVFQTFPCTRRYKHILPSNNDKRTNDTAMWIWSSMHNQTFTTEQSSRSGWTSSSSFQRWWCYSDCGHYTAAYSDLAFRRCTRMLWWIDRDPYLQKRQKNGLQQSSRRESYPYNHEVIHFNSPSSPKPFSGTDDSWTARRFQTRSRLCGPNIYTATVHGT